MKKQNASCSGKGEDQLGHESETDRAKMARVSPSLLGFNSPRDEMHLGGSGWKLSQINQGEAESRDGTQPHRLTYTIPTIREAEKGSQGLLGPQDEFKVCLGNLVRDILPQNKKSEKAVGVSVVRALT